LKSNYKGGNQIVKLSWGGGGGDWGNLKKMYGKLKSEFQVLFRYIYSLCCDQCNYHSVCVIAGAETKGRTLEQIQAAMQ